MTLVRGLEKAALWLLFSPDLVDSAPMVFENS